MSVGGIVGVAQGERLQGLEEVRMHTVPARHSDGAVVDAAAAIVAITQQHEVFSSGGGP